MNTLGHNQSPFQMAVDRINDVHAGLLSRPELTGETLSQYIDHLAQCKLALDDLEALRKKEKSIHDTASSEIQTRYANTAFRLSRHEALVLFSDGFTDMAGPHGDSFGTDGLKSALESARSSQVVNLTHASVRALDHWRAAQPPDDDISMFALSLEGEDLEVP